MCDCWFQSQNRAFLYANFTHTQEGGDKIRLISLYSIFCQAFYGKSQYHCEESYLSFFHEKTRPLQYLKTYLLTNRLPTEKHWKQCRNSWLWIIKTSTRNLLIIIDFYWNLNRLQCLVCKSFKNIQLCSIITQFNNLRLDLHAPYRWTTRQIIFSLYISVTKIFSIFPS